VLLFSERYALSGSIILVLVETFLSNIAISIRGFAVDKGDFFVVLLLEFLQPFLLFPQFSLDLLFNVNNSW
jgi:hypothetical protein